MNIFIAMIPLVGCTYTVHGLWDDPVHDKKPKKESTAQKDKKDENKNINKGIV